MCAIVSGSVQSSGRAGCRGEACVPLDARCLLGRAGLRPTRQRLCLVRLIYGQGDRHITAEELNQEVLQAGMPLSLATVYNTLNHLTEMGLLRQICLGGKTYFDTNVADHIHFLLEGQPIDVDELLIPNVLPFVPPEGMEVVRTQVVIHLRKRQSAP